MIESAAATVGIVYLVGAGPGDPGLLTVKGLDCIRRADVLVYDRLVNEQLLAEARPDCERIDAGKHVGGRGMDQATINALLVDRSRAGQVVTRLKGGDPFVFGRGGEGAAALVAAGLPFEVVPGVSSAIAVPAYAGIPLTHRGLASSFQVITGHENPSKAESALAWEQIAQGQGTLVVLMGVERLAVIAQRLIAHGRVPNTPVAVVRCGTLSEQQTVTGTLADIAARVTAAGLTAPAVIVVGEVVRLRERLRWFDTQPLFGRRVLVARSRAQPSRLSQTLAVLGAQVVELPVVQAAAPEDERPLDGALARLAAYDWVLFTSATAVERTFARLAAAGRDARAFGAAQVAAGGPDTAAALAARGIRAEVVVGGASAARLVAPLAAAGLAGRRLLVLGADVPLTGLVAGLERQGAHVEQVVSYRLAPRVDPAAVALVRQGAIDAVVLAGSGATQNLAAVLDHDLRGLERAAVLAIGPAVATTAQGAGLAVTGVAASPTVPDLVAAVVQAVGSPQPALVAAG